MSSPRCRTAEPRKKTIRRNILILNSYDWGTSWTDEQIMGFREVVLGSDIRVRIFIEQLDVLAHRGSFEDEGFSRHLDWRFGDRKFDLLFVTDNAALKYAVRNYQERFRGMPVVFQRWSTGWTGSISPPICP